MHNIVIHVVSENIPLTEDVEMSDNEKIELYEDLPIRTAWNEKEERDFHV